MPGPGEPDRQAAGGQAGHEAVARPGAETGSDVEARGQAAQHDPADQVRDLHGQQTRCRQHEQGGVGGQAEHDDVADRADARPLPQRQPEQEHGRADDDDDDAEGQAGDLAQPLVEHVPRHVAQSGLDQQGHAGAVRDEADHELGEAAARPVAQWER